MCIRDRHILEGYDNDWSKPSAEGKASYTKVAPGTYLFKVRSLRRSDGKTISESTLEVKVSQPWWNSWPLMITWVAIGPVLG